MKKLLICIPVFLMCAMLLEVQAQDPEDDILRTKKGVPILPQAGDWAIGIDASPFFHYFGNFFTNNNNPYSPAFGFTAQTPGAIYGKYKVSDRTTYRGALLIGISNEISKSPNAVDPDQVNKTITSAVSVGLIGGLQFNRQVFGRLIGIYGIQAGVLAEPYDAGTYMGKLSYKDGNDSDNNFKRTGGNTYSFLAGGFIGVEFFIAPRIALAGEFSYDVRFYTQGKRKYVPETGTETTTDYGEMGLELAPGESGNLQLLFYF
jgi:hypothetical protein